MSRAAYLVSFALASGIVATVAVAGWRRAGPWGLWTGWVVTSAALAAVGFLDWRALATKETPLTSYMLAATVPTLFATALVHWAATQGLGRRWQWLLAATACFIAVFPTLLLGMAIAYP